MPLAFAFAFLSARRSRCHPFRSQRRLSFLRLCTCWTRCCIGCIRECESLLRRVRRGVVVHHVRLAGRAMLLCICEDIEHVLHALEPLHHHIRHVVRRSTARSRVGTFWLFWLFNIVEDFRTGPMEPPRPACPDGPSSAYALAYTSEGRSAGVVKLCTWVVDPLGLDLNCDFKEALKS